MLADKAVGIDLGTTNSVAAFLDQTDRAMTFGVFGPADRPEALLPSAGAWVPERGGVVVGKEARARRVIDRDRHGIDVRRAVITVPAHFGHDPSADTTRAGEAAGLEVVELLREPVAAVIHYCWVRSRDRVARGEPPARGEETFFVYDVGGGTFDVTVIKRIPNATTGDDFQILAIDGDSFLGGDDFDALLAGRLLAGLAQRPGCRIASTNPGDPSTAVRFAQLAALAEELKRQLSDQEAVAYDRRDYVADDDGRPVTVAGRVTRDEFEQVIRHLAEASIEKTRAALDAADLRPDQLDTVLMVGGSARVPVLRRLLADALCRPGAGARNGPPVVHSPDLCVGAGAALKAASLGKVYRPPTGTTVVLRGYGSSARPAAAWTAEVRGPADPLTGGRAVLAARTGGAVPGEVLSPARAVFPEIPVPPDQTTVYTVHLTTAGGKDLGGFDAPLRHDPLFVEPIGLNTSANVLAYRLTLAVRDPARGEVVEEELARTLTALPNQFTHRFRFPGGGAAIRFPVHADGQLIRTVVVPVPPGVPAGARVILKVAIDANQKVRCGGEIPDAPGRKTFEFTGEPPPEAVPTRAEFDELEAKAQSANSGSWTRRSSTRPPRRRSAPTRRRPTPCSPPSRPGGGGPTPKTPTPRRVRDRNPEAAPPTHEPAAHHPGPRRTALPVRPRVPPHRPAPGARRRRAAGEPGRAGRGAPLGRRPRGEEGEGAALRRFADRALAAWAALGPALGGAGRTRPPS